MMKLSIVDKDNNVKFQAEDNDHIIAVYEAEYEPGDQILLETSDVNEYYVVRIDDTMDEAFVYLTKSSVEYVIPFEEKRVSYNPKSFTGDKHYLTFRRARPFEISAYKNLAKNVMDQHGDTGCFPHAYANVETRGEAVFAARNAIDGVLANESHGKWPYESWGINMQDDAEITLDFGRAVDFDKIVLYTRADFPHDNWWVSATLTFSDGSKEVVKMEKSVKPHEFSIEKKGIEWIKVSELIKADDPSPFPALSQIEVYGVESK
ncbi:carbohydrate-binding protein [Clostridium sp. chh4-2]|uniref:DUF7402 domain-containing protein n=1 Tax=Clostridium sp. chh4-2 TaxID=2067550 RepID=UPI002687753E